MASSFETTLFPIVQTINEYLSNYVLVILLLGVGIWYTIKTRCVQVRCFKEGWNRVFGNITLNGKKGGGGMSSFQALATAIAAQVGISGHLNIGSKSTLGAKTGVLSDIPENSTYWGMPAFPYKDATRQYAALKKLPALIKEVRALKKELDSSGK